MTREDVGKPILARAGGDDRPLQALLRDDGAVELGRRVPLIESLQNDNLAVGEELRLLAARMQGLRQERGIQCVATTSALPGEGKSTVCVGLAAALACEPTRRVLLVEADLRRPSLSRMLGLPPSAAGLGDYLTGAAETVGVRTVRPGGFSLIVAGTNPLRRPEVLASSRMLAVLRAARASYDLVLLDVPPLVPVVDGVLVQDAVDGFLMVVRSRQTPRHAVDEALAKLRPTSVIGLVLNDHHFYREGYRTYAYSAYRTTSHGDASTRRSGRRLARLEGRSAGRRILTDD